jgi:hypothetical protein
VNLFTPEEMVTLLQLNLCSYSTNFKHQWYHDRESEETKLITKPMTPDSLVWLAQNFRSSTNGKPTVVQREKLLAATGEYLLKNQLA